MVDETRRAAGRLPAGDGVMLMMRLTAEFTEMPGLRLTASQAARLFGVDARVCEGMLRALVDAGHLVRGGDGRFSRPSGV
ncbi:MAG: hypothetical protein AB7Q16_05525 [Vicinamibacterales bacterium]